MLLKKHVDRITRIVRQLDELRNLKGPMLSRIRLGGFIRRHRRARGNPLANGRNLRRLQRRPFRRHAFFGIRRGQSRQEFTFARLAN